MQKHILLSFLLIVSIATYAQNAKIDSLQLMEMQIGISEDSLRSQLANTTDKIGKIDLLGYLTFYYAWIDPQKGLALGREGLQLAEEADYKRGIAYCNQSMSFCLWVLGNYNESLRYALKALKQYEELRDHVRIAYTYLATANIYREIGDYSRGIAEASRGIRINDSIGFNQKVAYAVMGSVYERANQLDSALIYMQNAYQLDVASNKGQWGWLVYVIGNIHAKMGNQDLALSYYRMALPLVIKENAQKDIVDVYNSLSAVHGISGRVDSSVFYANQIIHQWKNTDYTQGLLKAANTLATVYRKTNQRDSLIKYLEMSVVLTEELFAAEKQRELQNLAFNEESRRRENEMADLEARRERKRNLQLLLIAGFIITFAIGVIVLSRKKSMLKTARFLALIGLLLIFEFVSLLTHPVIERITHHNPVLTLLALVLLASVLVPAHHSLEVFIRNKLTRRRRRKQAKPAIEETANVNIQPPL